SEPRRALDELMRQAGVLVAESEGELVDLAGLLSQQPLPEGDRVLVLTSAGAQGAILAELVRHHGLELAGDPIALPAGAGDYAEQIDRVLARTDWDSLIIGYVPLLADDSAQVGEQITRVAAASGRTTLACLFGHTGLLASAQLRVPSFPTSEEAVAALAQARQYHRWRRADRGRRGDPEGIERREAKTFLQSALADQPTGSTKRLTPAETRMLVGRYGIPPWPGPRVEVLTEAVEAPRVLGWPVALKPTDEVMRHRTDLGGVRLDLSTEEELRDAYAMAQSRVKSITGREAAFDIQPMAPPGAGCVVRAAEDELYGPIVSVGLAGDAVELLGDVSYRVPPLTESDVTEMVRSLRAAPRLFGHRGMPPLDVAALEQVLARVSVLKEELAEISRIVLHPVLVG